VRLEGLSQLKNPEYIESLVRTLVAELMVVQTGISDFTSGARGHTIV
jgi:hypothetical protein